jgi:hypothetical protein
MNETAVAAVAAPHFKHQLAKLVLGTIAGFAASRLTEKGYDYTMLKLQARAAAKAVAS